MTPVDYYAFIPKELRETKTWVNVWQYTKIPMRTDCRQAASSTNPESWGTFENAVRNVVNEVYDGIGYMFTDCGIVGIDVDVGFDSDGFLTPVSCEILTRCHSYTEKSRSGRGFHIFLRGDLPFNGKNNRKGMEIYKASRYFIMTGRKLLYAEIVENQEAIDYLLENFFSDDLRVERETNDRKIYSPIYPKPEGGKIFLRPVYPPIIQGGRHISLVSLAGQLHTQGYSKAAIYRELLYVNFNACKPPLGEREIESICESITKYRR